MKKVEQQKTLAKSFDISPKVEIDVNILKKIITNLERGQESTHIMRRLLTLDNNNDFESLNQHSKMALDTFDTCLSQLKSEFDDSSFLESNITTTCCKKRKVEDSREEEVGHLIDDGYVWKKYGQKLIINSIHPRHYYRCANKHDKKCSATKLVQQISNVPTKYKIIYNGNHSCNNSSPFIIDSCHEQSSGIVVSFDNSNQVDPLLFPPSAFPGFAPMSPSSENVSISNTVYKESEEIIPLLATATSYDFEEDFNLIMPDDFTDLFPYW